MSMDYPSSKKVSVLLKLPPEVVEEIDRRSAGPAQPFDRGGRAGYITNILYRELGLELPQPARRGEALPLHLVDETNLTKIEQTLVILARDKRLSYRAIADYLNTRRVPPLKNNKRWYSHHVAKLLNRIIAVSFERVVAAVGS